MATKKKVHKATTNARPDSYPLCGRGIGPLTKDARRVTCGRCQMLMKFAAKRVAAKLKKGRK